MSNLGQYFTTNNELKEELFNFILNNPKRILEPSIGQGDLVDFVKSKIKVKFDSYEIDNTIKLLNNKNKVTYTDFLTCDIKKTYKTIIGNPPYVRTKNGNLYLDFINKCYDLLEEHGELIFIIPSDFFKLTSSGKLLNKMVENGTFTHIYHPNNENLFENASIDVLIFRYEKCNLSKKVLYNKEIKYLINNNGLILFESSTKSGSSKFEDYFEIYVGIVSGKESVYKNDKLGNIDVINGFNKIEKYIFIEKFPSASGELNEYLLKNKNALIDRKIRKFNEKNWFEWGALRNVKNVNKYFNEDCIYIHTLTRKNEVAFIGKVGYFGGSLILLKPKVKINLDLVVNYLNSDTFKNNFMFSGRFKITHRNLCNSCLPEEIIL
jgi:adenine-specific DNA-methyltransferase